MYVHIDDPIAALVLSLFLLFSGFVVFQFGIRVFGFLLGCAVTFLTIQLIEVYSGSAISHWMYLGVSLVGGVVGFFLVPLFARAAVMFLSFLFGLLLPELLAGVQGVIPLPADPVHLLLIRLAFGGIFLVLAHLLFIQIVVVASALVGASLLADFLGRPAALIPLFVIGLLTQLFLMKRLPGKGVKREGRKEKKKKPAPRPASESRTWEE